MKVVIVTGASSGIGEEFVKQLDKSLQRIDEIWMVARNKKKMEEIAAGLTNKSRLFSLDLERPMDRKDFNEILSSLKPSICMLINSAGFGIMGDFASQDIKEQLNMIELNCKALTHITYMALPFMTRNGRILQIASSAAFMPQANFAVYGATKAYVLSFSRALQEEIRNREIFITTVCPGPVETPFFDRAEKYGHTLKLKKKYSVTPDSVVKNALKASQKRKSVAVCSVPIKGFHLVCKLFPHDWLLEIAEFLSRRERKNENKV